MIEQSISQIWQPKPQNILVHNFPVGEGIKFVQNLTYKGICEKCNGPLVDASFCTECRGTFEVACLYCGTRRWEDLHEFCYCQLDLLGATERC